MAYRWLWLSLGGALGGAACDDGAAAEEISLAGSVARIYPLDFHHARARLSATELAIQYVAEGGAVPVQIVVDRARCPVAGPGRFALPACGALLGSRGPLDLPPLDRGELRLDAFAPAAEAAVAGDFDAVVTGSDGRAYAIRGRFSAPLEVVGP